MGGAGEVKGTLPPGFRFHPTDEELITHYLGHKVSNTNFAARAIADVDFNKCEPWDLPGRAKMGEKAWYFFSTRDRKYPTGVRTNRATNTGYWKTTGKDKEIFCSATAELLGMKKTLVFYKGRAPRGEKSNWVMHEYRLHTKSASSSKVSKGSSSSRLQDEWVVCRVFQKSSVGKKSPMNHPRANPHNLGVAPPLMSTPVIQGDHFLHHPYHFGSQLGRSYADLAELTRALRWNHGMDLPVQYSQGTYAGSSALPGLNLNLVAPSITPPPGPMQPVPRLLASLPQQLQVAADTSSMSAAGVVLPGCNLPADEGFGAAQLDINAHSAGGRWFQQVDRCVDLDGCHWASY